MKFSNVLSAASLMYAGSVAYASAMPGYGDSPSTLPQTGDSDSSTGGGASTLPATGDSDSDSTTGGGSASPSTGDSDSSTGGSGDVTPPVAGGAGFTPAVNCRNDICYSAVVPASTASTGSGPIWFQIYAPTKFAWVGMGTGNGMADSNMFIVYQNGNNSVTLSHRQADGRVPPEVPTDSDATVTLLPGSGITTNGFMIANFRCDNCTTWKGTESLDFTSSGTPMMGAWEEGDSLDSSDVNEAIGKHTGSPRSFAFDLSTATKSTAGNPFQGQFSIPAAAGSEDGSDGDEDVNREGAASGKFALLSGSVAVAAIMTGLSLVL